VIPYCLAPNCLWRYSPTVVLALGSCRGRLDNPICRAGKRHVWGTKAKLPVTHLAGGFAVFEAAFLCWSSLREKSICSQMLPRLTSKGRGSSPIRPKDANFGLDLLGRRGLLFVRSVWCPKIRHRELFFDHYQQLAVRIIGCRPQP
jgi:hypothetical protein